MVDGERASYSEFVQIGPRREPLGLDDLAVAAFAPEVPKKVIMDVLGSRFFVVRSLGGEQATTGSFSAVTSAR